ncbi:MAG: pilus assembly protein TadG-related protein [Actinomycetota bacterium]|nr:pilus assembly protein TadG-related protein [Actinomycetota bacterium]
MNRRSKGFAVGDERGSVLLLGVGFVIVCLLAIAVVTDVSAAFLQRRSLMSMADAAAIAGAQAIDQDAYYADGASIGTRLDPGLVRAAALGHLVRTNASTTIPGLQVNGISSDGVHVLVALSSPLRLPFFGSIYQELAKVEASARLDYRPSP